MVREPTFLKGNIFRPLRRFKSFFVTNDRLRKLTPTWYMILTGATYAECTINLVLPLLSICIRTCKSSAMAIGAWELLILLMYTVDVMKGLHNGSRRPKGFQPIARVLVVHECVRRTSRYDLRQIHLRITLRTVIYTVQTSAPLSILE